MLFVRKSKTEIRLPRLRKLNKFFIATQHGYSHQGLGVEHPPSFALKKIFFPYLLHKTHSTLLHSALTLECFSLLLPPLEFREQPRSHPQRSRWHPASLARSAGPSLGSLPLQAVKSAWRTARDVVVEVWGVGR